MEYKLNDNLKNEKLKNLELEKTNLASKQETQISIIRKEYDQKISKMKEEMSKIEYENRIKDEQLMQNNNSNDKMSVLIKQKVEFLENELNVNNARMENLKQENEKTKKENEELSNKIDEMKIELNKKKMLEFELEKLRKEGLKNSKLIDGEALNLSSNSIIEKTNLKKQAADTRKVLEEVMSTIKANSEMIPKNISDTLEAILQANKGLTNIRVHDYFSPESNFVDIESLIVEENIAAAKNKGNLEPKEENVEDFNVRTFGKSEGSKIRENGKKEKIGDHVENFVEKNKEKYSPVNKNRSEENNKKNDEVKTLNENLSKIKNANDNDLLNSQETLKNVGNTIFSIEDINSINTNTNNNKKQPETGNYSTKPPKNQSTVNSEPYPTTRRPLEQQDIPTSVRDTTSPDPKELNKEIISLSPIEKRVSNTNNILLTSNNNYTNFGNERSYNNFLAEGGNAEFVAERANLSSDYIVEIAPPKFSFNKSFQGNKTEAVLDDNSILYEGSKHNLNQTAKVGLVKPDMDIEVKAPKFTIGKPGKRREESDRGKETGQDVEKTSSFVENANPEINKVDRFTVDGKESKVTSGKENEKRDETEKNDKNDNNTNKEEVPENTITEKAKPKKIVKKTVRSGNEITDNEIVNNAEENLENSEKKEILKSKVQKKDDKDNRQIILNDNKKEIPPQTIFPVNKESQERGNFVEKPQNAETDVKKSVNFKEVAESSERNNPNQDSRKFESKRLEGSPFVESSSEKASLFNLTQSEEAKLTESKNTENRMENQSKLQTISNNTTKNEAADLHESPKITQSQTIGNKNKLMKGENDNVNVKISSNSTINKKFDENYFEEVKNSPNNQMLTIEDLSELNENVRKEKNPQFFTKTKNNLSKNNNNETYNQNEIEKEQNNNNRYNFKETPQKKPKTISSQNQNLAQNYEILTNPKFEGQGYFGNENIYSPESFRDKNFIANPNLSNTIGSPQNEIPNISTNSNNNNYKRNPSLKENLKINTNNHPNNDFPSNKSLNDEYFEDNNLVQEEDSNPVKENISKSYKSSYNNKASQHAPNKAFSTINEVQAQLENPTVNLKGSLGNHTQKPSRNVEYPGKEIQGNPIFGSIPNNNTIDLTGNEVEAKEVLNNLEKKTSSKEEKKSNLKPNLNFSDRISNIPQSPKLNDSLFSGSNIPNVNYQEIMNSNKVKFSSKIKNLATALQSSESRIQKLEEKINSLKEIKSIVNNSAVSIQCKICKKSFDFEAFRKHPEMCEAEVVKQSFENKDLKIKILKGLLKKDELNKPYIEYIIEVEYNHQNWRISRKFNQFTSLHKYLKKNFPNQKLPESAKLFSKFDTTHEQKQVLLEKYLKDLNNIQEIKKSRMFSKFFGLDEYADLDFDLELNNQKSSMKKIEENKEKTNFFNIPKGGDSNSSNQSKKELLEEKNLKIDLNKINNYNPEKDSDTARSKRKNKNLSFS